jgi:hypothetical protein
VRPAETMAEAPSKRTASKALVPTGGAAPSTMMLVREAMTDAVEVMQAQLELAALEVREDAREAAKVAAGFAIGAALAMFALAFLGAAAAFALALVLPAWAACLIVAVAIATGALLAVQFSRNKLSTHDFKPERTLEALRAGADSNGERK